MNVSPTSFGSPEFDCVIMKTPSGRASTICCAIWRISSVPRPQFAPMMRTPMDERCVTAIAGLTPIIVRKFVSNDIVAIIGNPGATAFAASTAASTSAKSLIVSIRIASTPPATKPLICSENNSFALSGVRVPIGSMRSPDGPISPMTKQPGWRSATLRAIAAPA